MSISSSANDRKPVAVTRARESSSTPITLSEWSSNGVALIRIFVGYLWFQQLFWKMPPNFTGLYSYIIRESQHTIIPGYGYILQHTFLSGCISGRCMDCRTDSGHFPDVRNFHTYRSYSWYGTRFSVIRRAWLHGMVMDIRHVSAPMPVSYSNPGRSASGC